MGTFRFKRFQIDDSACAMKIGTDGVLVGAWADAFGAGHILDIGCGSGLIALMMAQRFPDIPVTGVEIDGDACSCARGNVSASPWSDRIEIVAEDVMTAELDAVTHPVCIVSNPPFYTEALRSPDASRALARHGDGLNVLSLISLAGRLMNSRGDSLTFIAPAGFDDAIQYAMSVARLTAVKIADVTSKAGKPPLRRLYRVERDVDVTCGCIHENLCIRDSSGAYTPEYIGLTRDFYINL